MDYFEEDKPVGPSGTGDTNDDDAMVEKFRQEFLESLEGRRRRRPASAAKARGVKKEPSRGPKLGGSRSARAAMRQERAAKKKK